jgi:hypothetical protein
LPPFFLAFFTLYLPAWQSFDWHFSCAHLSLSQTPFVQQLLSHLHLAVQALQHVPLCAPLSFEPVCARAANAMSMAEPAITSLRFIILNFKQKYFN